MLIGVRLRRGEAGSVVDLHGLLHPRGVLMAARIRVYVPQRQMLPSMALSIWLSVGLGVFCSSAAACMIWPGWQYPHCATLCCLPGHLAADASRSG